MKNTGLIIVVGLFALSIILYSQNAVKEMNPSEASKNRTAGDLVIDDFDYKTDVEAQQTWKGTSPVKIDKMNKTEGGSSLTLPCSFKKRGDRCLWDRKFSVPLDLSAYKYFRFEIFVPEPESIKNSNIYFGFEEEGKTGWFRIDYDIKNTGWNKITLSKKAAVLREAPKEKSEIGWKKISIIRISFWGGQPEREVNMDIKIDNFIASKSQLVFFSYDKQNKFYSYSDIKIIPVPHKVNIKKDVFQFSPKNLQVYIADEDACKRALSVIKEDFSSLFNINLGIYSTYPCKTYKIASIGKKINFEDIERRAATLDLKEEGYFIDVLKDHILIISKDETGFFYGFQTLKQLIQYENGKYYVVGAEINDNPSFKIRGFYPGKIVKKTEDGLNFHKKLIRMCSSLKINYLFLEPASDIKYEKVDFPETGKNAYTKEEIKELCKYAKRYHVNIVPYYHFFSHIKWIADEPKYRDLLEQYVPSTNKINWCPSNPKVYEFARNIIDEAIETFNPSYFHITHDEITLAPMQLCDECKKKTKEELILKSMKEISDYLIRKGVTPVIWADMLYKRDLSRFPDQYKLDGDKIIEKLPKEVIIANWNYGDSREGINKELSYIKEKGFKFTQSPWYSDKNITISCKETKNLGGFGIIGTTWYQTRNSMDYSLWSESVIPVICMTANYSWNSECEDIYFSQFDWGYKANSLIGNTIPSYIDLNFSPVDISEYANFDISTGIPGETNITLNLPEKIYVDKIPFIISKNKGIIVGGIGDRKFPEKIEIKINKKCDYLFFLHTSNTPLSYGQWYHWSVCHIRNHIGNYKVFYRDGNYVEIPLKARLNILFWNSVYTPLESRIGYQTADKEGNLFRLFLYEVKNPYPEKEIEKIEMSGIQNEEGMSPILFSLTLGTKK